jgi:hypothetical protein
MNSCNKLNVKCNGISKNLKTKNKGSQWRTLIVLQLMKLNEGFKGKTLLITTDK